MCVYLCVCVCVHHTRSFDLLHVMIDETTEEVDNRIAQHIIRLHRYQGEAFSNVPYTTEQLQRWERNTHTHTSLLEP